MEFPRPSSAAVSSIPTVDTLVKDNKHRSLKTLFWATVLIVGAIRSWGTRHYINPDGISYLDLADAYVRGDWATAVNAYWSPLYACLIALGMFLLEPSPYWEFSMVHLVNLVIFLFAAVSFQYFLSGVMRLRRRRLADAETSGITGLPQWSLLALGYVLFLWSSVDLLAFWKVHPDTLVAGFVYLTCGIIVRIQSGDHTWRTALILGVVLGFGYLAKAPMFPLGCVFLLAALFSFGSIRRALPRVLATSLVFASLAGPYILTISLAKGRLTIGDSGRLNYAWIVNRQSHRAHKASQDEGAGPRTSVRKVFDRPAIFQIDAPNSGTYPPWLDPTYWNDGVKTRFDLSRQMKVLVKSIRAYAQLFFSEESLIVGLALLFLLGRRGRLVFKDLSEYVTLLIPVVAALGMYALLIVLPRYVGPFIAVMWVVLACAVRLPNLPDTRRFAATIAITISLVVSSKLVGATIDPAYAVVYGLIHGQDIPAHVHWQVADHLNRAGIRPGDKVASMGKAPDGYWARLARVQIVGEVPPGEAAKFWMAEPQTQAEAINTIARMGAKALVAETTVGSATDGWKRVADTDFYIHLLDRSTQPFKRVSQRQ